MNDRAVIFEHEVTTDTTAKALATSVKLNGELRDVNRKIWTERNDMVNALELIHSCLQRKDPEQAEQVAYAALAKWGRS